MPSTTQSFRRYTFGEFTLDTRRGALLKQGAEIKIRAQSFQVLTYLVNRHGSLVSKDELHRDIWRSKIVSDDSITHCLLDIRKALGDVDKSIIRTVPRRGYIFDLPCHWEAIEALENGLAPRSLHPNKAAIIAAAAAFAVAVIWLTSGGGLGQASRVSDNSIAVLPFADMSEAQDQRYLGDGLSDEILNLLSRSPDLRVMARTSSFSFTRDSDDIATIREALSVAFVLEGSVRRSGDKLFVTAQLIDTASSVNVWSESYERRPDSLVAVQKEIADAVLQRIAPHADKDVISPARRSFSAIELMYLAQYYEHEVRERPEVDQDSLQEAIALYRDAIRADPDSALAHSRLAGALLYAGDVVAAEAPTMKALSLDPNLSEVQETLGEYYWLSGLPGVGMAWKRAVELNPNNPDALSAYAFWYWMQGYDEGPEALFRRALRADLQSLDRHAALGEFLAHMARVDKAREVIERIEERFDSPAAYRVISRVYELIGEIDHSIVWAIRARDVEPDNPEHVSALAELYAEIGDFDTALALEPEPSIGLLYKMRRYEELVDKAELKMIDDPNDLYLRYVLAFSYNAIGDSAGAIRILRSVGQPDSGQFQRRMPMEVEGLVTYIDALDASGDARQAKELAEWFDTSQHISSDNWWIHVHRACVLAVLGRDEQALQRLERAKTSPRLPWDSAIRDWRCFQRYQNEPRYLAVLADADSRRAELRRRLSESLRSNLVAL